MICESCQGEIPPTQLCDEKRELCEPCWQRRSAQKKAEEFISLFLKHDIKFTKEDFGYGSGFILKLPDKVDLIFFNAGAVRFEQRSEDE